jgi:hypothetical protein
LAGIAQLAKHGQHSHCDQKKRDNLDNHLQPKTGVFRAFLDGHDRVRLQPHSKPA